EQGHEALVGMMDEVAAGLQVSAQPGLVARLEALLKEEAETLVVDGEQPVVAAPEAGAINVAEAEPRSVEFLEPNDEQDREMVEILLVEAVDLLQIAGGALARWLADPSNQLALSALLRDLHTLKGGARMAAIRPIGDLAHELEALYEGLTDGRYAYSP